ncbi:hypothetical protein M8J77_023876 [Diaphorina citri]|nr:hypothetical protein M8J77_023876 [Diaphorina citri]
MESYRNGIKPFDGEGFSNWKFRIEAVLDENECSLDSFDDVDYSLKATIKRNAKAKNILIQGLDNSQLEHIKDCNTAVEIMQKLCEKYVKKSISEKVYLKKCLNSLKYNEKESLDKFLIKFDEMLRKLADADVKMEESEKICCLLLALPDSFNYVVAAIETMVSKEELTLDFVKNRLLDEDLKRSSKCGTSASRVEETSSHSFAAFRFNCHFCGKPGHKRSQCYERMKKEKNQMDITCYKCGKLGHKSNQCKSRFVPRNQGGKFHENSGSRSNHGNSKGYPKQFSNYADESSNEKKVCFLNTSNHEDEKVKNADLKQLNFVVDSGCTDHIVNDISVFHDYIELKNPIKINIAKDDQCMSAVGIGTIETYITYGGNTTYCTLKNVLYVPSSRKNLLSVKRLDKFQVLFEHGSVKIIHNNEIIVMGLKSNLYEITFNVLQNISESCVSELDKDVLWHRRFGHISFHGLKEMINKKLVNGIDQGIQIDTNKICEPCIKGKMTRLPFSKTRDRANDILQIVHTDLCGPIDPISHEGYRYILTFLDDYSHFLYVYLLKEKSEVFDKFKEYFYYTKSLFNKTVNKLRCDNGGEYKSKNLIDFCNENGVLIDYTISYTPELNGKSERVNRTIIEKARTMLSEANVPKVHWSSAVYTAVYLLNRSYTTCVDNKTPAEVWYNQKPDISNLKVYGCIVYYHVPKQLRSKLDEKAKKGVFLGYCLNGYRVLDIDKDVIVSVRDVKFIEDVFHFREDMSNVNIDLSQDSDLENVSIIHRKLPTVSINNNPCNNIETRVDEPNVPHIDRDINKRQIKLPRKLSDYEMYMALCGINYVDNIPQNYDEALASQDKELWLEAMSKEINSIEENKTWSVVPKPVDKQVLSSKWVYAYKEHEFGEEKYKARLVVRGFAQDDETFSFDEIYSPVAKMTTIRTLLAVAVEKDLHLHQLDVNTAFLNGHLENDVYLYPPKGLDVENGTVLKLNKALYGLKQASYCWNKRLNETLQNLNFKRSEKDYCLYTLNNNGEMLYLIVFVDDIILASKSIDLINIVKSQIGNVFKIKDKGQVKNFLGLEIEHDMENGILKIKQSSYIDKMLKRFNMEDCNETPIPIDPKFSLDDNACEEKTKRPYRELIGSIMYLMLATRPDLSFCINFFSRYQNNYCEQLWQSLKRVLRYIKGTRDFGLIYEKSSEDIILDAYVDSDWGCTKIHYVQGVS